MSSQGLCTRHERKKTDWKETWFSNEFITYFGVNAWHVVHVFSPLFSFTFNLKMYIHAFIRGGLFQDSSWDPVFCFHLMDPESVSQVWRQVHLPTELSCRAAFIFEAGYEVVQAERKHLF